MNFKFEVNKKLLFYLALTRGVELENWVDLQNELWDKYRSGYQFLKGDFLSTYISPDSEISMQDAQQESLALLDLGMRSTIFSNLLSDVTSYKEWLENEWKIKGDVVTTTLRDILRINLPQNEIKVFIVSNKMKCGQHIEKGNIVWGHPEDWENYSLIYLAHEYLHDFIGRSKTEHAIIELIADNELRIRLNKGEYFYVDGNGVGHDFLLALEKKLLPSWETYLADKSSTIFDFIKAQKTG